MRKYTLFELLEEIKMQTPKFEKGQYFEVLKTIYPNTLIKESIKNIITEENKKATKPLACSSRDKREFEKNKGFFNGFSKDKTRGDFLEIIETTGFDCICINKSLPEDIVKKYYDDDSIRFIKINFEDIVVGNVKRVFRGIGKYI